jgi:hypothetical protein
MAEFYFNCPFCKKQIKAETEWIGRSAECPFCLDTLVIKEPQPILKKAEPIPPPVEPAEPKEEEKKPEQPKIINCPDCNKEMSAKAEVCPHCGAPNETLPQRKSKNLYVLLGLLLGTFGVHNMYAKREQAAIQFVIALFSIIMSVSTIHSNNSDEQGVAALIGTLGFIACGIWALCDICSVETDGDGVPFR